MDANTGEVVIKSTIDSLREQVGHENLFTLTFIAKEVGEETARAPSMSGRKMDSEFEHLVGGLGADLPNEADSHNRYIVNDHFYDDESDTPAAKRNGRPISSSLTSDLLAIDSQVSGSVGDRLARIVDDGVRYKADEQPNAETGVKNAFGQGTNESLASLQSANQRLNRTPLKSTPINVPPLSPTLFARRIDPERFGALQNPFRPLVNLTTREVKRLDEPTAARPSRTQPNQATTSKPAAIGRSTSATRAAGPARAATTSGPASMGANTAKPFFVTSKPLPIRSTTDRPTEPTSTQSAWRPMAKALPSVLSKPIQSNAPLIAQNQGPKSSGQVRNVNLANDNLVADEHYIVNNLTSIGMMDENFKPENLIEPESSAEISRFNNERVTMMNAVLSEITGASRTETEITIGFVILQISNHAPEFPLVKPNFTGDNNVPIFIMHGQIDDDLKPGSVVQFEHELLVQDQEHGLNGTFDAYLSDPTKTFDVQPKIGYRNQSFQILVSNSSQLSLLGNKLVNMKVGDFFFSFFCARKKFAIGFARSAGAPSVLSSSCEYRQSLV